MPPFSTPLPQQLDQNVITSMVRVMSRSEKYTFWKASRDSFWWPHLEGWLIAGGMALLGFLIAAIHPDLRDAKALITGMVFTSSAVTEVVLRWYLERRSRRQLRAVRTEHRDELERLKSSRARLVVDEYSAECIRKSSGFWRRHSDWDTDQIRICLVNEGPATAKDVLVQATRLFHPPKVGVAGPSTLNRDGGAGPDMHVGDEAYFHVLDFARRGEEARVRPVWGEDAEPVSLTSESQAVVVALRVTAENVDPFSMLLGIGVTRSQMFYQATRGTDVRKLLDKMGCPTERYQGYFDALSS